MVHSFVACRPDKQDDVLSRISCSTKITGRVPCGYDEKCDERWNTPTSTKVWAAASSSETHPSLAGEDGPLATQGGRKRMNEPRGRPVAKPVTGGAKQTSYVQTTTTFRRRHLSVTSPAPTLGRGLNARAKPSPLLVLSPSSTGGQPPPPLLPPSSLRGHPIRWKTRPRKLPRGRGAGATTAAEDPPKLIRKKNAATTRSSLSPGPDEGRTSAQSSSSSCSSSSSTSSSSGARRRPRKPTDAEEEEEEGSVASRSV